LGFKLLGASFFVGHGGSSGGNAWARPPAKVTAAPNPTTAAKAKSDLKVFLVVPNAFSMFVAPKLLEA
jgi:hypothetical protein